MIHYHGTPVGGSRQDVARFLMTRHAAALLLALSAGLLGSGSASDDPAQRVEKPAQSAPQEK